MTDKPFRPLLAATVDSTNIDQLTYPLMASPKLDGIRAIVHPTLGLVSRTLKPIPNKHIQEQLRHDAYVRFDGELIVGPVNGQDVFNRTQSGVMAVGGTPDFRFHVFDIIGSSMPFAARATTVMRQIGTLFEVDDPVSWVPHTTIYNKEELLAYENNAVLEGYEGIMLRRVDGPYKQGRSTFKEGILLKMKRYTDDEGTVVGFEPLQRNHNAPSRDARGLQVRTAHLSGKVADDLLGALILRNSTWDTIRVGSGFDEATRREIWANQGSFIGRSVTFKYFSYGTKEAPRQAIFKGFRDKRDI